MSNLVHQMIKKKIKQLSPSDLLNYSEQYGIVLTKKQAIEITSYLKQTELNPMNEEDRIQMFKKLAHITDLSTAQKVQKLFNKLIKQYGVESWFH